ncbi:hypothetical protein NZ698_11680 [Chryseobacterium sp. PBS4-4]|uniref:DUF4843 domain-containing protein n=1 Tax=Chryseobacterium edaphi TaxID=2976532 RepID=A0ABT2W6N1_9FLAO|nr:hypothetical protein [Chryseobacterium edaphi]MCU7617861.1 hypothetical protein [Chryseobacterium edaphi]
MKKILSLVTLVSLLFVFNSCKDEEEIYYEGDSLVNFDKTAQIANVILNNNNADYLVTYGVTKASQSDNTVEIVFDAANSTAVLGTDFTIVEGTDVLKSGSAVGDFKINVKESAAKLGKKAVFTLKSNTLGTAPFNKKVEVAFTLVCPAATFPGVFSVKNVLFGTYDVEIVAGTVANTFILKDYIETGFDITVNFNPLTGEVSLPVTQQSTGYVNGANGVIFIKPAIDGSRGTVDFCNKIMNLRLSYGTPGGATYTSGGATSYADVFTGY